MEEMDMYENGWRLRMTPVEESSNVRLLGNPAWFSWSPEASRIHTGIADLPLPLYEGKLIDYLPTERLQPLGSRVQQQRLLARIVGLLGDEAAVCMAGVEMKLPQDAGADAATEEDDLSREYARILQEAMRGVTLSDAPVQVNRAGTHQLITARAILRHYFGDGAVTPAQEQEDLYRMVLTELQRRGVGCEEENAPLRQLLDRVNRMEPWACCQEKRETLLAEISRSMSRQPCLWVVGDMYSGDWKPVCADPGSALVFTSLEKALAYAGKKYRENLAEHVERVGGCDFVAFLDLCVRMECTRLRLDPGPEQMELEIDRLYTDGLVYEDYLPPSRLLRQMTALMEAAGSTGDDPEEYRLTEACFTRFRLLMLERLHSGALFILEDAAHEESIVHCMQTGSETRRMVSVHVGRRSAEAECGRLHKAKGKICKPVPVTWEQLLSLSRDADGIYLWLDDIPMICFHDMLDRIS